MKNKYQDALIALLSGITTKKNDKEIWWKDEAGEKATYEGLGGGKYVERYYDSNENIQSGYEYKDGKLNGVAKTYYENGNIWMVERYKEGKLNGVAKSYDENGNICVHFKYLNGQRNGISKGYNINGDIAWAEEYKDDQFIRTIK